MKGLSFSLPHGLLSSANQSAGDHPFGLATLAASPMISLGGKKRLKFIKPSKVLWGMVLCVLAGGIGCVAYLRSDYRKFKQTEAVYEELEHPQWSTRIENASMLYTNRGSGSEGLIYLVDVRRVSIPLKDAAQHYKTEARRLGLIEFHADSFSAASDKFSWEWEQTGIRLPDDPSTLVLSQRFPVPDHFPRSLKRSGPR